jgi:hypothetical protein
MPAFVILYHNATNRQKATLRPAAHSPRMVPAMLPSGPRRILVTAALVVALVGCSEDMFDSECDLVVLNDSACDLVVFVDGREAFTVRAGSDRTLDDIGNGRHVLEVLDTRDGLVERRNVDLTTGEDYYWILDDC